MRWTLYLLFTIFAFLTVPFVFREADKFINNNSVFYSEAASKPQTLSAVSLAPQELAILEEINSVRSGYGLAALRSGSVQQNIASLRTKDMQIRQYYSHVSPDGNSFSELIPKGSGFACENLLLTEANNAKDMVNEWLNSESHRECILSTKIAVVGVSLADFDLSKNNPVASEIVAFIATER